MTVYIDGKYYTKDEAKISVYDHGLLYGDGIFEGIRLYHDTIFKLDAHLERLWDSAKAILLTIPIQIAEMKTAILETVRRSEMSDGYIRLVVTRGKGDLGISPSSCPRATVIIIVDTISLYADEYYRNGIKIITASTRRTPADSLDPKIKSLNYLNNVMAKLEAHQMGCLEAIMLNQAGYVAECTGDNIFIIKNGELITPDPASGALNGITRQTIMDTAESIGIPSKMALLTPYDLYTADECFLTGTAAEVIPVISIDSRVVGDGVPGEFTADLREGFQNMIS